MPDGQEESQVNHEEFGVHSPDDALIKSLPPSLQIIEDDQESYKGNFGRIKFDNEWNSHLTIVFMRNGTIVGFGDSGTPVGGFEPRV